MKKIIDIPDEIVQDLKILAVKSDKDLKNFIQDELVKLVRDSKKKEKYAVMGSFCPKGCNGLCYTHDGRIQEVVVNVENLG